MYSNAPRRIPRFTQASCGKQDAMWIVYLLRCGDGTLYAGVTNDLPARLARHRTGKGAKYTRGRGPLRLVWSVPCVDKGEALRREHAVKKLRRREKLRFLDTIGARG
jgi:putative endonuclease